jgi:hypothetical protein
MRCVVVGVLLPPTFSAAFQNRKMKKTEKKMISLTGVADFDFMLRELCSTRKCASLSGLLLLWRSVEQAVPCLRHVCEA